MDKEENISTSDGDVSEPCPKKIKSEWCKSYSNKAMQMMCRMGYESDKGLGKQGQGRLEPVEAFQQEGRRGFGLKFQNLIDSSLAWDPDSEDILIPETLSWLQSNSTLHTLKEMRSWIVCGQKKISLEEESLFCDPQILKGVLDSKSVFDELDSNDLRKARSRSNPFETIRCSIFQNRAAVKMANIDSLCNFMFTYPLDKSGKPIPPNKELLYFADICAGPGGFTEYILYRKAWEAKGFGFTLRGPNDFKLEKFFAASPESFDPFYGCNDDGNIYDENNQRSFQEYIHKHCELGVHFVMADGGFSVEGQEDIQEILSKQLYLCQCLTALSILRIGGHFVCKLFDTFTLFSVGLIYLMLTCFEEIAICKPNSSRPANSERYLICKGKKSNDDVSKYLNEINLQINKSEKDQDVLEIVSYHVLSQNESFLKFIIESNNIIGRNQIVGLKKIAAFCQNSMLKETRQAMIRRQCLHLWNLPDKLRQAPEIKSTEKLLEEILDSWFDSKSFLSVASVELTSCELLQKYVHSIYDWHFIPIGRGETSLNICSIFLCRSRGSLFRYNENNRWELIDLIFEISPKSLFYGEIVYEYCGEGRTQTRISSLHIIDAIMLGGKDIRRMRLIDRIDMCEKFARSLNKPHKDGNIHEILPIRCKTLYALKDVETFFNSMTQYNLKDNSSRLGFPIDSESKKQKFFVPGGIILLCEISHNFVSEISKSTNSLYYFDIIKKCSYYFKNMPTEVKSILFASFRNSFSRRLLWKWTNTMQVEQQCIQKVEGILYRDDIHKFIYNK